MSLLCVFFTGDVLFFFVIAHPLQVNSNQAKIGRVRFSSLVLRLSFSFVALRPFPSRGLVLQLFCGVNP